MKLSALGAPSRHYENRTVPIPGAPWQRALAHGLTLRQLAELSRQIAIEGAAIERDDNEAVWRAYNQDRAENFHMGLREMGPPPLLSGGRR